MNDADFYLYIEQVQVQDANAVSSPLTYGFPAITGFLGAIHALERKIPFPAAIHLDGVLIASHSARVKRYRPHRYSDYTLNQSRNPIKRTGKTASIIEEGKLDMTVSLVVPVCCREDEDCDWVVDNQKAFTDWVEDTLHQQRMAGGSVFSVKSVQLLPSENLDEIKSRLAPAFILMDAKKELIDITEELQHTFPQATSLDALMEVAVLHHIPETGADEETTHWRTTSVKHGRGWLVPMPVGYQGVSPLYQPETMQHNRTPQYHSQFVEALYSLGKWVFPHTLPSLEQGFWRMTHGNNDIYLVDQTAS